MVAPEEIEQFKQFLSEQGFKYSTMIENVGDLIKLEKVSKIIDIHCVANVYAVWPMFQRVRMREGGGPIPLAFQYLILVI